MELLGKVVFLNESEFSNQALVDGLLEGNVHAAAALHRRFSVRISRWVWRLLGTDDEHDDVVQQVFLNVLSAIGRLDNIDSLASWVDSVTVRTVRYELRKRRVRRLLFSKPGTMNIDHAPDRQSPFNQAHIRSFYAILETMPSADRILFVLRYLEECSVDQIAAAGGYSHSTAKRRLQKAKSIFMRRALKDPALHSLLEAFDVR